jgi:hypothetical protein
MRVCSQLSIFKTKHSKKRSRIFKYFQNNRDKIDLILCLKHNNLNKINSKTMIIKMNIK